MSRQTDDCGCKIGRVTTTHEIPTVDTDIVDRWQSGTSIRRLTEELNKEIIASELDAANVGNIEWSRTPVYEMLRTDELSDAEEIEIRRELKRAGINVEQLAADLVSHQTVYRHLTNCLDASKGDEQTPDERRDQARNTVHALQQRTELVIQSTLESLQSANITDLGEPEVLVDLQIVCSDCGASMDFETALNEGCHYDTS